MILPPGTPMADFRIRLETSVAGIVRLRYVFSEQSILGLNLSHENDEARLREK